MYTVDTIDTIPPIFRSKKYTSSRSTDDITLFFTKNSPLSNFHESPFEINDQVFNCAEQYLAYHKALLFDQQEAAQEILSIQDPILQKQKAKDTNLKNFDNDKWKQQAGDILRTALVAKFDQNSTLKDALLSTGDTLLAEASPTDTFFGIGLSLNNRKAVNQLFWRGDNLQVNTLMAIREQLK